MNDEERMLVILDMTEQQQKSIAAAIEELERQTAKLNSAAPEFQKTVLATVAASLARGMANVSQEAQSALFAAVSPAIDGLSEVAAAANQAEAKLNQATAKFGTRWLLLAGVSAVGVFLGLMVAVQAAVWWERSEIERLTAEKNVLEENIARFDQLRGRIKISSCGENSLPCVEVETGTSYGTGDEHRYFILKGVKFAARPN